METYDYKASDGNTYTLEIFTSKDGGDVYARNFDLSQPYRGYDKRCMMGRVKKAFAKMVELLVKNPYVGKTNDAEKAAQKQMDVMLRNNFVLE
jgi:hypothetical protein